MEMGLSLHVVGRTPERQNKALNTSIQKVFNFKKKLGRQEVEPKGV